MRSNARNNLFSGFQFRLYDNLTRTLFSGDPLFQQIHRHPSQLFQREIEITSLVILPSGRAFAGDQQNLFPARIHLLLQKFRMLFVVQKKVRKRRAGFQGDFLLRNGFDPDLRIQLLQRLF